MGNRRGRRIIFAGRVYALCRKIPEGRISTYKLIGKKLGRRGQIYRAVGAALSKNKSKSVPCHRVINSDGSVGGFARGTNAKIKLLRKEGIEIKGKKIMNFEKRLFRF